MLFRPRPYSKVYGRPITHWIVTCPLNVWGMPPLIVPCHRMSMIWPLTAEKFCYVISVQIGRCFNTSRCLPVCIFAQACMCISSVIFSSKSTFVYFIYSWHNSQEGHTNAMRIEHVPCCILQVSTYISGIVFKLLLLLMHIFSWI